MSLKKKINDIKKNYSLGIIGGGQLALMLTEAAKKKRSRGMCANKIL